MSKKKVEPITGVSRDPENKLVVQKSNPLSALWRSDLSLAEFKIMDVYLSRIDSHQPERRAVRLERGKIEQLLGVKKIDVSELKSRVQHLMAPLILDDGPKSFRGIVLFEEAVCDADEDGVWQVDLECTQKAMKYFFNVEKIGYFRYKLRCVSALTSRYSYVLFMYLEANRFRKSWEVDLDELRHSLGCDEPLYQDYRRFNERILKRCQIELSEKSECRFTYEPIRKGRSVSAIRFTIETLSEDIIPSAVEQLTLFDAAEHVLCDGIFTAAELDQLRNIVAGAPESILPALENGSVEQRRDLLIEQKYRLMRTYDEKKKPIKNKFLYVKRALEKDCKKAAAPEQPAADQEHSFDPQEFLDLAMKRSFKNEPCGGKAK